METLKFKTNIKCDGCIAKISPVLNADSSIEKWEVDLLHPDKILTVSGERISGDLIKSALKNAGYIAELL
ncbi:MAG TPA: heavy-metal-associated domain-containing protein [Bacteroidales bacterium]|nr:heavy-metal-associated domain-containing protein [Bacteroidales bacterium]